MKRIVFGCLVGCLLASLTVYGEPKDEKKRVIIDRRQYIIIDEWEYKEPYKKSSLENQDFLTPTRTNTGFNIAPIEFGVGYYMDHRGTVDQQYTGENVEGAALFAQLPIKCWFDCLDLDLGVVVPLDDTSRTRPIVALSFDVGQYLHTPGWMPLKLGIFGAISPYNAWGIQLSLLAVGGDSHKDPYK